MEGGQQLELTDSQRERLDQIKAECSDEYTSPPSDQLVLSSLLDTWDAAGDGFYSEDERGDTKPCLSCGDELRDRSDGRGNRFQCPRCGGTWLPGSYRRRS